MSTQVIDPKARYTIEQAAPLLGIKPFHMHELILPHGDKAARIPAVKGTHPKYPKIPRWTILGADLIKYSETRKSGVGKRIDGRNKYTLHLNADELAKVQKFLKDLPGTDIKRANPPKA